MTNLIAIAIAGIAAIVPSCEPHNAHRPPARPAQVIYVPENYPGGFDAQHGDIVIVILFPEDDSGAQLTKCDRMGGELIYNPFTTIYTCEKVDF